MRDYHYSSQIDAPKQIGEEEWERRASDWKVITDHLTWAQAGITIQIIEPRFVSLVKAGDEDIPSLLPSWKWRLWRAGMDALLAVEAKGDPIKMVEMYQRGRAGDAEVRKKLAAQKGKVAKKLKRDLTADDLFAGC